MPDLTPGISPTCEMPDLFPEILNRELVTDAGCHTQFPGNCKCIFSRANGIICLADWPRIWRAPLIRQEKRAQRFTFWVRRPPGGVGVFHAKGRWPKSSCSPSKVCLPWVSKRWVWDVPGIMPGCSGPLGVFKKLVLKKFVRIFRSLIVSKSTATKSLGKFL